MASQLERSMFNLDLVDIPMTVVEICNASFAEESSAGKLEGGAPDPYCKVKLSKEKAVAGGLEYAPLNSVERACEYKCNTLTPTFRFHADMGVEADQDDLVIVEMWDYDTFTADDFLGMALIRVKDLTNESQYFQMMSGRMEATDKGYPKLMDPSWLSKRLPPVVLADGTKGPPADTGVSWVRVRRCSARSTGVPEEEDGIRDTPIPSQLTMYFLRHGESEWNKAQANMDVVAMASAVDHPLDPVGISQCQDFNKLWKAEMERCASGDADGAAGEADGDESAVILNDFLEADAIYASPLCRATQTCLIGLQGHPALVPSAEKPHVTLVSTAREIKKLGGMDTVGGFVGDAILDNVKAKTIAAGYEKEAESMGHIVADPYDSQNEWWTTGDDFDNESDLGNRFYSFMSTIRFSHRSGIAGKPTIVVGHSLFMREFCIHFMDPELAESDPIAMKLTQQKLSNASMVRLELEFDDQKLDEVVRIVGVTPVFGMGFHEKADARDERRGGQSLMEKVCCCLGGGAADPAVGGEGQGKTAYDNPLSGTSSAGDDEDTDDEPPSPSLRMARRAIDASPTAGAGGGR